MSEKFSGDLLPVDTPKSVRERMTEVRKTLQEIETSIEENKREIREIEEEIESRKNSSSWIELELGASKARILELKEINERYERMQEDVERQILQLSSALEALESKN